LIPCIQFHAEPGRRRTPLLDRVGEQRADVVAIAEATGRVEHRSVQRCDPHAVPLDRAGWPLRPFDDQRRQAAPVRVRADQHVQLGSLGEPSEPVPSYGFDPGQHRATAGIEERSLDQLLLGRRPALHDDHAGERALPQAGPDPSSNRLAMETRGDERGDCRHRERRNRSQVGTVDSTTARHGEHDARRVRSIESERARPVDNSATRCHWGQLEDRSVERAAAERALPCDERVVRGF
jgi:hypothetical protein